MSVAGHLLAVWLTPALWLAMPGLIVDRGPGGLWIGLGVTIAPLIALAARRAARAEEDHRHGRIGAGLVLVTVGVLIWANLALAGDVAGWLGLPRWRGVAIAAIVGWLSSTWRGAGRMVPALLLVVALALSLPLAELMRDARAGPLAAWERVATQAAFRFSATSAWVTAGRDLGFVRRQAPLAFEEEHRVTAPAGGQLHARSGDGGRAADAAWTLSPGQSITLRAGDQLLPPVSVPLRFEAGKRVPGAPPSGMAWAAGGPSGGWRTLGLHVTLLLGGVALLSAGGAAPVPRTAALALGGGLVAVFVWAQGWAIYGVLGAPDVFLGGVTAERVSDLHAGGHGAPPWRQALAGLVLAAGLASFAASSIALKERVVALHASERGDTSRVRGRWVGAFGLAGLASLAPADPWWLMLLALGLVGAALGPATLWPPEDSRAATAAGAAGVIVFAALVALGGLRGVAPDLVRLDRPAWLGVVWDGVLEHPMLAAAPAGAAVLWLLGRRARR